jgi:hypothetical protein
MEPQHLISIGVAFLFAVSASASLVLSSSNKHDRISSRIRGLCNSFRGSEDSKRNDNIKKQIEHFFFRYQTIQKVQEKLYSAIREFIVAFCIYILMSFVVLADKYLVDYASLKISLMIFEVILGLLVAIFFVGGIFLIWKAAHLQVNESMEAHKTLKLEFEDIAPEIESRKIPESKTIVSRVKNLFQN